MDNIYKHIVLQFDQAPHPKFVEKKTKGYVEFGEENNYPDYLLSLYNNSPKHGSIIKSKSTYIVGKGFEDKGTANTNGESWNDILTKQVRDDEIFRGFYLQVIWNRAKKVSEVFHLDFSKVRASKDLSVFYVKNDWCDYKEKAREYPAFNVNNPVGSQIFFFKEYNPLSAVYPYPSYFQGLNYIESDIELSRHILGNAKRGWSGSTLVNLNGGEPVSEEHKGEVEKAILKKFTGADGKRVVIMFNKSKDNAAEVVDLGNSILTKEDFTNINNLIQNEIFASHQITSPTIFGITTPGTLGQRNEMRDAYEIWNNTYCQNRQKIHETIITKFRNLMGEAGEFTIRQVEPLKFEFSETIISQNLTQDEIREIMGREPLNLPNSNTLPNAVPTTQISEKGSQIGSNDAIRNLSGRQYQNVMRIVRNFANGKLNKEQATLMLKSGFGFNDADVNTFLGIDDNPMTDLEIQKFNDQEDERMYFEFANCGEDLSNYDIINSYHLHFSEIPFIFQLEANILEMISNDKRVDVKGMAEALNKSVADIETALKSLEDKKIISTKEIKVGSDVMIERSVLKPLGELSGKKPNTETFYVRYTYEWRVPESQQNKATSRLFCRRMMELSAGKGNTGKRTWSMSDIQNMSTRLGYSVFDRCGGWWNNDGEIEYQCRHQWVANIVTKK
jgi:hypothetical protein